MEGTPALLGVVLAGGGSVRFGSPKGLAPLGGRPMAEWALRALTPHFPRRVVIANDPGYSEGLGVPVRGDLIPGMGPLGGLATALAWAREEGLNGVFLLACDLPLVSHEFVGRILHHGFQGREAVVPASEGPLGMEPLCAAYNKGCLPSAEALLAEGGRSMRGLLESAGFTLVPMDVLGGVRETARAFLNVNTPGEAAMVEEILGKGEGP